MGSLFFSDVFMDVVVVGSLGPCLPHRTALTLVGQLKTKFVFRLFINLISFPLYPCIKGNPTVLDSEFRAVDSGFQVLGWVSAFLSVELEILDCGFQSLAGFRIP